MYVLQIYSLQEYKFAVYYQTHGLKRIVNWDK